MPLARQRPALVALVDPATATGRHLHEGPRGDVPGLAVGCSYDDRVRPPLDPDALFHLATPEEWDRYQAQGLIEPPSLVGEGFVHCSWGRQVAGTVTRHFAGVADLLALRLDPTQLGSATLVEEDTMGSGQRFPHLYGAIPLVAVLEATPL